jgi:GNAT superfamily N-acetyltransferase
LLIRAAVPGDISALRNVFRRSALSVSRDQVSLLAHPEMLELSDRAVSQGRVRAAVADSVIAGLATWLSVGDVTEIEDLFVDPDWMRQGLGRALVLDLIAIARGRGARRVFLAFPPEVRRVIHTTNLIESMNARLRKVTRNRGPVPLRAGRAQGALPRGAEPAGLPQPEHRNPELGLETGAPGVHDLLRRTNPNPMTATITYTDGPTPPG